MEAALQLLLILALFCGEIHRISTYTDPNDVAVLQSLKKNWENVPPSWQTSNDPCGTPWDGVTCNNDRVTALHMSAMGIKGKLEGDIGGLTSLISLDLSNNPHLTGPLSARLGDLKVLNILILLGCSFSGSIPEELGNLGELTFLALNSNKLIGKIPPSLGKLSKLYWLDLADNQLSGPLPVSTATTPGLDSLLKAKHFHFNKNKLSDSIPLKLFSSQMVLIHLLFDGNQFTGEIPESLGLVKTLEVVRLDRNALSGEVPSSLNNLTNVNALHMEHNKLSGSLPDLSGMNSLTYVDLSNNSFLASEAPYWLSKLTSLTTVVLEYGSLEGPVPNKLFSFPQIQQVKLRNNAFDKLNMSNNINPQLVLVDLQNNKISTVTLFPENNTFTLMLVGNPVCSTGLSYTNSCKLQQQSTKTYYTKLANCGKKSCKSDQKLSPQTCDCEYPFEGTFYFTAPHFRELSNAILFQSLEVSLRVNLRLSRGSVSLQNLSFNIDDYLEVQLGLFPTPQTSFNMSEIQRIGFELRNRTIIPNNFGPYSFHATPYSFTATHGGGTSISRGVIVGIIVGCAFLVIGLLGLGIYAISQKKRFENSIVSSKPFASWAPSGNDSGGAPQLKGARWFSYDELKKCTSNFSTNNEIGSGGYGKVYRGLLPNGQVIAIKRARDGSMQGRPEFKNEIELLSRVHHKNLVGLVGFCFEQGEQMLVYEFMPNGTLRESLSGRSGIYLDWKKRLQIALGSARGLAYLHELADPPIIHRDIKSTNILLDEHLTSKVADFGLSKLISEGSKMNVFTEVKGTLGYLDPEYYMTQQLTKKSDVYSYGVVMLELITAKQPIVKGKYIVHEVKITMDKNDEKYYGLREMIDPSIINNTIYLMGFRRFLELAMQCVQESADDRPTMSEIVKAIEVILQNEGTNTNSTSTSSSVTDFGTSKVVLRHPYNDLLSKKIINDTDAFDYSCSLPTKIKPK